MKSSSRVRASIAASVLALAVVAPTAATASPPPVPEPAPVAAKKSTPVHEGLPSGVNKKKTLVIGLDGAALAQINKKNTPNMAKLISEGLVSESNLYAEPMAPTVSVPAGPPSRPASGRTSTGCRTIPSPIRTTTSTRTT